MHRKSVLFVNDSLRSPERYDSVARRLDADFKACPQTELLTSAAGFDLVIFPVGIGAATKLADLEEALAEIGTVSLLLVLEAEMLNQVRLPVRVPCDFIVAGASEAELEARIHHLLWPGEETVAGDFISVDSMTINLSTYQVQVDGQPVDFTYLEYALLAFLITHPGHVYSRDALLRRVWGFEYYGGSRTVDVHVRRVRAKLGPQLSERLETVRGVGYLWIM